MSWCPSSSDGLWQWWSCGLVHCPGGNATDPIWRVLASSQGISSWTPLKPQHSNPDPDPDPDPKPFGQSAPVYWRPYSSHASHQTPCLFESLMPLKSSCSIHARWSKSSLKHCIRFCCLFSRFKTEFLLHILLLKCPHVQIAFLKFTSCDTQVLVGRIPTAAVAVDLKLKS